MAKAVFTSCERRRRDESRSREVNDEVNDHYHPGCYGGYQRFSEACFAAWTAFSGQPRIIHIMLLSRTVGKLDTLVILWGENTKPTTNRPLSLYQIQSTKLCFSFEAQRLDRWVGRSWDPNRCSAWLSPGSSPQIPRVNQKRNQKTSVWVVSWCVLCAFRADPIG